jgi:hypothetical protein
VVKKFFALSFLRHDRTQNQILNGEDSDLRQVLAILSNQILGLVGEGIDEVDVVSFLLYFNQTWMVRERLWNVFGLNKNRTNNHMEGWHCHLKDTIQKNPNMWKFIKKIKAEQTAKEAEVNLMNHGEIIVPLTKKNKKKERKLALYKVQYIAGTITPINYVSRVSLLMNY